MRKLALAMIFCATQALAASPIQLPNLNENATGTLSGGKYGVDVNINSGSVPLPTGAATSALQTAGNASLTSIDGKITAVNTGAVVVSSSALPTGAATAAKQPALGTAGTASADVITVQGVASMTALKVDGSGVTQPVSAASLPLPTGAATEAKQDTGNGSLSSIDGKITAVNTGAVVISSSALPTGASTEAKQDTGNTSLSNIDGKLPALVSSRVPVDGSGVTQPISASALPLPTGASTEAKQDTGNSSLSSIDGKITAVNTGAVVISSSALPSGAATAALQAKWPINTTGSYSQSATLTTVVTETAPANAVGFILEASSSNAANIRWAVGAVATITSGMRLEPGRDTGFVPLGANVSIVAESGTLEYQIQWVAQ